MADNNKNTDKNNENDVKNAENAQKNAENAQNNAENKNNENNKAKSVKVRFLTGYWGIYGTFQTGEKASIPENVAKAFAKDKVCEILKDKE